VTKVFHGKSATPDVTKSALGRQYQSVIRNHVAGPAEFAGHYRVAEYGCGSTCHSFIVVDMISGKVFPGPSAALGADFQTQSRLFVTDPSSLDVNGFRERMGIRSVSFAWNERSKSFVALPGCDGYVDEQRSTGNQE
jgi:hypothetical protein